MENQSGCLKADVIVLAAGSGNRMAAPVNKMFLEVNGIPILYRTLYRFNSFECINRILLVAKKEEIPKVKSMISRFKPLNKISEIVKGGKERSDSVRNGLIKSQEWRDTSIVMTHDGARPFVSEDIVKELIDNGQGDQIAIPVTKINETLRQKGENGLTRVVDRSVTFSVQTPQVFDKKWIDECFVAKDNQPQSFTDEASYFEVAGLPVKMIEGESWNIKITNPDDIAWAEFLLQQHDELNLKGIET